MSAESTRRRLNRMLAMVAWVIANPYPRVSEVMERFGYRQKKQLAKDLALLFVCGLPGYGPEDLMVAFIEDDLVVLDMADYFSRPLRLTPPEALGLLSAGMAAAGLDPHNPALDRAVEKLTGALFPEATGALDAELPPEPEHLDILRGAAADRRAVRITYLSVGANRTTTRVVEPSRVQASLGWWYLQAHCRLAGAGRTFRVDRIRSLDVLGETFDQAPGGPPEVGFTPSADSVYTVMALGEKARWVAEYYSVETVSDDGGELVVRFASSDPRTAARLLIRLGGRARLVEGEDAAQETERLRSALLARYGEA